ncbi:Uncharacterised protein [Enterobacter cloacae]|nr:Uncharacterised protein [Enterobacter cloacae]
MVVTSDAVAGVCTPYHAAQTGVHVQIVSYWVTQFSGQLYALSFESAIYVVPRYHPKFAMNISIGGITVKSFTGGRGQI